MTIVALTFAITLAIVLGAYWFFVLRIDQSEDRVASDALAGTGFAHQADDLTGVYVE